MSYWWRGTKNDRSCTAWRHSSVVSSPPCEHFGRKGASYKEEIACLRPLAQGPPRGGGIVFIFQIVRDCCPWHHLCKVGVNDVRSVSSLQPSENCFRFLQLNPTLLLYLLHVLHLCLTQKRIQRIPEKWPLFQKAKGSSKQVPLLISTLPCYKFPVFHLCAYET